jgi:hypothetical protein
VPVRRLEVPEQKAKISKGAKNDGKREGDAGWGKKINKPVGMAFLFT